MTRKYGDAFGLIKKETAQFDLIIVDFPYPFSYDLWKLYSVEFYLSLKKRMNKESLLVLDAPVQSQLVSKIIGTLKSKKLNSTVYSTLKKADFPFINFFSLQKEGFVIASLQEITLIKDNLSPELLGKETIKKLSILEKESFEYTYDESLINSIFRPQFLDFNRDF